MPIIDVRSPSEYIKGHASGAISIPLFSDEQRAEIGTIYKKKGSKKAIRLGLEYVGPRMHKIVDKVVEFKYKITGPWDEPTIENISTIL